MGAARARPATPRANPRTALPLPEHHARDHPSNTIWCVRETGRGRPERADERAPQHEIASQVEVSTGPERSASSAAPARSPSEMPEKSSASSERPRRVHDLPPRRRSAAGTSCGALRAALPARRAREPARRRRARPGSALRVERYAVRPGVARSDHPEQLLAVRKRRRPPVVCGAGSEPACRVRCERRCHPVRLPEQCW